MADNQLLLNNNNDGVGGDEDVFVYTGGEQRVPRDVKRVRIAENVDTIPARTFQGCQQLIEVEGHNKIKKIERRAFNYCPRLRRVTNMTGVIEIGEYAFYHCYVLSELDFDKLEIIGKYAFVHCNSFRSINIPSIRRIGEGAFMSCYALTDVVLSLKLETIEGGAFLNSRTLRRIAIPLKDNLIVEDEAFSNCEKLSRVDIIAGGIQKSISSLHLESWRNEMLEEIDRIDHTLPNIRATEKTEAIQQWIERVLDRMEHYKSEHQIVLKEAMTLLELALWKAKLLNEKDEKKCNVEKKAKIDTEAARKEHRVTCGASIVIKNVLPFLALKK